MLVSHLWIAIHLLLDTFAGFVVLLFCKTVFRVPSSFPSHHPASYHHLSGPGTEQSVGGTGHCRYLDVNFPCPVIRIIYRLFDFTVQSLYSNLIHHSFLLLVSVPCHMPHAPAVFQPAAAFAHAVPWAGVPSSAFLCFSIPPSSSIPLLDSVITSVSVTLHGACTYLTPFIIFFPVF